MATQQLILRHLFEGGWSTDFGPTASVPPAQGGVVSIPWLREAKNCIYELDGGPHKAPGTTKLNSSALESGASITGLFDCWFSGTSGNPSQHRIIHIGTKIKKDDGDGSFSDLFTGLTANAVPNYSLMEDVLVIASSVTGDVPRSWDGSTAQNLAGSPPDFSFAEVHKNRMWAAGVAANPSRLYYSVLLDPEDWTSAGSGSIDIDPDDGDKITAIMSHKDELIVFKGPYKNSIHRIAGSSPTGDDPFARKVFVRGISAVWQNAVFRFSDDIGFVSPEGTVHSLSATAAFGDFREAALSRPIHSYIRERVNKTQLEKTMAVNWSEYGVVLIALPVDGNTSNNMVLMWDYRFDPPRWAEWEIFGDIALCLASVVDGPNNNRRVVMSGADDGFVRKWGQSSRSIDGITAIPFYIKTPHLDYGSSFLEKILSDASLGIQPRNAGDMTFGWERDGGTEDTVTINQGGAAALGSFVLGTDALGGARYVEQIAEIAGGGSFRSISFSVDNGVVNEDVELHSITTINEGGGLSLEQT